MNKLLFLLALAAVSTMTTCKDDNPDPNPSTDLLKLSISSVTSFEGDDETNFNFKVSASAVADKEIQVNFSTEEVTAGKGTDFVDASGTLTIAVGEREAFIEINIVTDTIKEADEEFKVILSNPVNATITTAEGTGTIRNDDTFVAVPDDGYITPESYTGYDLVWQDEFNGNGALNPDDWTHEIGNSGWGNNELQYYTESANNNAFQSGGQLVIEAREEAFSGAPYTSARLITKDKQTFTHGRVDIRAILPEGQGIWPALWMLGNNISTVGWPACGEIDVMELVGHQPSTTHGTAHWGPQGQGFSTYRGEPYDLSSGKFSDEFHVFSIVWEPGEITWFVDDNQFFRLTNDDVNGAYPFDMEFFFIFNIAVGGNWPGYPDETTVFPQRMFVDYIRMFQ